MQLDPITVSGNKYILKPEVQDTVKAKVYAIPFTVTLTRNKFSINAHTYSYISLERMKQNKIQGLHKLTAELAMKYIRNAEDNSSLINLNTVCGN